jgi:NodT family efflux transporter outer membrane factor (OMF) lipoprotein
MVPGAFARRGKHGKLGVSGGTKTPDAKHMMAARGTLALGAALALAGCGVGPRYHRPAMPVPAAFTANPPPDAAPLPSTTWWRSFGAPELDRLIDLAAAHSLDVQAAAARIIQADQAARVAGSPLLPGVTGTLQQNYQRTGQSQSLAGLPPAEAALFGGGHTYTETRTWSAELSASYEVDFWGKNLDALRAAQATALGSRYDAQTTWLTTSSSIATTYFEAAGYRDRLAIAEHNLKVSLDLLGAYRGRLSVGTASLLDVSQQEALVASTRAQIPALQSEYQQEVIALGILVGLPPEQISIDPAPLTQLSLPVIGTGLPADLLRRRPDVAYAEAQLISQNQTVRQDVANFYPSLQLTAEGGLSSTALSMLTGPGTTVASLANSITQTIFDNGTKEGTLGEAKGRYKELAADYAKAFLQALTDSETALTQANYAATQETLEAEAVRTAQRSADIVNAQLSAGTVDITTVLNTQTTLFNDEDTLAQVRVSRFMALVSLYKALGGGWSTDAVPWPRARSVYGAASANK